jgi:signal transduction histidine kinase/HPt (histidine-containing phosphotransfer) domain-containing protein
VSTFLIATVFLCLALALTMSRYQRDYLDASIAPAVQGGRFLQNHLQETRLGLIDFAALPDAERTPSVAALLPAYSDLYAVDRELRIRRIYKSVPQTQVFPGFSLSHGPLGELLRGSPDSGQLSRLMPGYEDSRSSIYFATPSADGVLVGRLDLGYVQEFLRQFSTFSQTPALLVGRDGFVMLSSDADLAIPAINIGTLRDAPVIGAAIKVGGARWIPVASETLEIGSHVVILVPSAPLERQRMALIGFLAIAIGAILLVLIVKNLRFRSAFIRPFSALGDRLAAIERGDFAAVDADTPPPRVRFKELAEIESRFAGMAEAIHQRECRLLDIGEEACAASRAKTRFLANMSHEIRTPMNVVLGLTHILGREPLIKEHRAIVDKIDAATGALLTILNDILDISKIEANELTIESRPFRLGSTLDKLRHLFSVPAAEKGLSFAVSPPPPAAEALIGDPARLHQILTNLVGNAIKFTDQGGVSVTVEVLADHGEDLVLSIAVRDTGIGISEAQVSQLFMPFFQVDDGSTRRFGGTGLGLSICRRLAELMAGRIELETRAGKGSCFRLIIPYRKADAATPGTLDQPEPATADRRSLAGHVVLVVDDSESNRFLLDTVLRRAGARVDSVSSAHDALACLALPDARYSVVLMDLQMPVMDGIEAITLIRTDPAQHDVPILALTADALGSEHERALRAGADQVFVKPLDLELLTRCLQALPTAPPAAPGAPLADDDARAGAGAALDAELLARLRAHFSAEHADAAARIAEDLANQRRDAAARRAHSIKGMAAQLGEDALARHADALQQSIQHGETARSTTLLATLDALLTATTDDGTATGIATSTHAAGHPSDGRVAARPARILIVDDDPVAAEFLHDVLVGCGEIAVSRSGRDALGRVRDGAFDLVVLDALMPDLDGFETCVHLLELQPDLSVIFITAADDMRSELRALAAGAIDFISKPLNPALVRARINAHCRLRAQAEALAHSQRSLREESAARSRLIERDQLLQDMHDGFGSQIAAVRMQLSRGEIALSTVDRLLGECLDDLRLVVQEMENPEHSLADAIADFRFRLAGRLSKGSPQVSWHVDLAEAPPPRPKTVLQTLRILQEAVNNALAHAQARHLRISAVHRAGEGLTLRIDDDGIGFDSPQHGSRGLNNMHDRARRLGGTLTIRDGQPGTCVCFILSEAAMVAPGTPVPDDRA